MTLPLGSFVKTSESGGRMETGSYVGTGSNQFVSLPFVPRKIYVLNWDNLYESLWQEPMEPRWYIRIPDLTGLHKKCIYAVEDGISPVKDLDFEGSGPGFLVESCHSWLNNLGEIHYWIAWE